MASRTAWTAGNGAGLSTGGTTLINGSDLASLANGSSVRSTVADIANQTNLDIFLDVMVRCQIASNTIVAGANLALFIYYLLDDGTTYGDGQLPTAGTAAAITPVVGYSCGPFPINLVPAAAQTLLVGYYPGISISPRPFRLALQNNSGFTLTATAGNHHVQGITYNTNLNN